MDALITDFEKVVKRQNSLQKESMSTVDNLISAVETLKSNHVTTNTIGVALKTNSTKLSDTYKDAQTTLQKFGKVVDKRFKVDLDSIWNPKAFAGKERVLNSSLTQHFIREGRFQIAEQLSRDSNLPVSPEFMSQFLEMFQIQAALKSRDLKPAIAWCVKHGDALDRRGSYLPFLLHKLQFMQLVLNQNRSDAIKYAKSFFPQFSAKYFKEIQKLMCSILFMRRVEKCPYTGLLLDSHLWLDVQSYFARDFCFLLGLASESALQTSLTIGTAALPTIVKMSSIMKDKSGLEWSQQGEMPVEVPLPESCRFHSVFACPVSKEQASETNPPMMMLCGHVISKESLSRLCKGNPNLRFKCPYCPVESTSSQAIRVYF